MSSAPEDFKNLRGLLACKRHEVPPPGYFHTFSDRVIASIEDEKAQQPSTLWEWFLARFDARPFWACAYGFAVSSLLLMGFRFSQMFEAEAASVPTPGNPWLALGQDQSGFSASGPQFQPQFANAAGLASFSSISPEIEVETRSTHFPSRSSRVLPASFSFR
jgi:hypothetical protein